LPASISALIFWLIAFFEALLIRGMVMLLSCQVCERFVEVKPYRESTFKFCSRSCLMKARLPSIETPRLAVITGKKPSNFAGQQRRCVQCDKLFYFSPSRYNSKKFCTRNCYASYQRTDNKRPYKRVTIDGRRILEHRYVMEMILDRKLLPTEHVHHKNRVTRDNRPENLEVIDIREHGRISASHRGVFIVQVL
jgi:HNH endonuclease